MSFCKRLLASFLAASLALGVFCPVQAYAADRETPAQWAAWIGEALANGFTDLVHSFEPAANISGIAAWSLTYGTSSVMAQAVRDLPEYKELYGSNPLDHSTVIHAYDGGEMVSVLDPSGLYAAYLWLHEGVPPYDDTPSNPDGPISGLPDGIGIIYAEYLTYGNYTFADGHVSKPYMQTFVDAYNEASAAGTSVAIFQTDGGDRLNNMSFISGASGQLSAPSGDCAFSFASPDLATLLGVSSSYTSTSYSGISTSGSNFRSVGYNHSTWFPLSVQQSEQYSSADVEAPVSWYKSVTNASRIPKLYVITNSRVFLFGNFYGGQIGPTIPPSTPPVGPSSPDIQNPEPPDVPESDGPIQYNTTTNVTVTLPDGTTTIVEAPTVDTLPIVHWLSIINSNLVAWSRTIYEAMDGWLANISQWLQEIYSEVEAFKLSMDAWMVSLLSAIDKLGGDWPMGTENNTDYWNNVTVVNNNIWNGAPDLNAVNVVADDFERLKGKFPVSIPWDLAAILLLFKADPVTPEFSVPLVYFDGSTKTQTLDVDLQPFDGVMSTWRRLVFIAFAGALALKSKDLLENFAEVFNIV